MRLWKTPERLRRIAILLFLSFPVLLFASLLVRRMPWWQWDPTREWLPWIITLGVTSALAVAITRAHKWAVAIVAVAAGVLTLDFLFLSLRQENVGLGLFAVAFGIAGYAYVDRVWAALQFPALSPGTRWYQSTPEPIPGLALDWGDRRGLRLSQLNLEGGFILGAFDRGTEKSLPGEITLLYRGSKIACGVTLISGLASKINSSWAGIGVEFKNTDLDSRKDLADFIEVLRGEGHVSS